MRGQYVNVRCWGLSPFSLLAAEVAARFVEGGWELAVPGCVFRGSTCQRHVPTGGRGGGTSVKVYNMGCGMSGAG